MYPRTLLDTFVEAAPTFTAPAVNAIADVTQMKHRTAITILQSTTVVLVVYLLISAVVPTAEAGFWSNELQEPVFPTVPSRMSSKGRGTPLALRVQCLMACCLPLLTCVVNDLQVH